MVKIYYISFYKSLFIYEFSYDILINIITQYYNVFLMFLCELSPYSTKYRFIQNIKLYNLNLSQCSLYFHKKQILKPPNSKIPNISQLFQLIIKFQFVNMKKCISKTKSQLLCQNTLINQPAIQLKKKNAEKDAKPTNRIFGNDITCVNSNEPKKALITSTIIKTQTEDSSYHKEIINYIRHHEDKYLIEKNQTEQQCMEQKRKVLIKYAFNIYFEFNLRKQTLHLAIYILDKYLQSHSLQKTKASSLINACLLIAMKYEEIYPPDLEEFVSKNQIRNVIEMESQVILKLDFKLNYYSSIMFFRYWIQIFNIKKSEINMCQFFLDIILFNKTQKTIEPSLLSLAVILLITKIHNNRQIFIEEKQDMYAYKQIQNCAKQIAIMFEQNCDMAKSIFNKYSHKIKSGESE